MDIDIKQYIKDIKILRAKADKYDGNAPGADMAKIELLTKAHMLMGRVAAVREGEYLRIYAQRKVEYAKAKKEASRGDKETAAELAVASLRMLEADAKEEKLMWKNEFESVREAIFELRLRVRRDLHTLGGGD